MCTASSFAFLIAEQWCRAEEATAHLTQRPPLVPPHLSPLPSPMPSAVPSRCPTAVVAARPFGCLPLRLLLPLLVLSLLSCPSAFLPSLLLPVSAAYVSGSKYSSSPWVYIAKFCFDEDGQRPQQQHSRGSRGQDERGNKETAHCTQRHREEPHSCARVTKRARNDHPKRPTVSAVDSQPDDRSNTGPRSHFDRAVRSLCALGQPLSPALRPVPWLAPHSLACCCGC